MATQGAATLRDNIVTVFGTRVADGLEQLSVDGPDGSSISGHAPPRACPSLDTPVRHSETCCVGPSGPAAVFACQLGESLW